MIGNTLMSAREIVWKSGINSGLGTIVRYGDVVNRIGILEQSGTPISIAKLRRTNTVEKVGSHYSHAVSGGVNPQHCEIL